MSDTLNEAVALLTDLLTLSKTTTSLVDQDQLDFVVNELAVAALEDVDRFIVQRAADAQDEADAKTEAEGAAARQVVKDAKRDEQALVQDEEDEIQRRERLEGGVS